MATIRELRGEWAVVTGASSGIGLEFCKVLAESGCNIVMISNQPKELAVESGALRDMYGIETIYLNQDLSSSDAYKVILLLLHENNLTPKLLINNAGIFDFRAVSNLAPDRLNLYIDLHIRTTTHLAREIGDIMSHNGGGYILNMSSMSCWMPMPGIAMYSATKAYIRAFSRAYRVEMKDKGVSVTVACPGGIATDLFGLPKKLQCLGVKIGVLVTPKKFVHNALKRTLKGKPQYINGVINRVSIVAIASLPEWCRYKIKTHLLDKFDK